MNVKHEGVGGPASIKLDGVSEAGQMLKNCSFDIRGPLDGACMAVLAGMASGAGSQQVVAQAMGGLRDAKGFEEIIDGLVDGVGEECPADVGGDEL